MLDAETQVFQVGINLDDAVALTGISAPEQTVRRTTGAGRYVLGETVARGPAMFDTARLGQVGGTDTTTPIPSPNSTARSRRRATDRQPRRSTLHHRRLKAKSGCFRIGLVMCESAGGDSADSDGLIEIEAGGTGFT